MKFISINILFLTISTSAYAELDFNINSEISRSVQTEKILAISVDEALDSQDSLVNRENSQHYSFETQIAGIED